MFILEMIICLVLDVLGDKGLALFDDGAPERTQHDNGCNWAAEAKQYAGHYKCERVRVLKRVGRQLRPFAGRPFLRVPSPCYASALRGIDMETVRMRPHPRCLIGASVLLLLAASAPSLATAQSEGSWLCRVRFEDHTWGGDALTTRGVIELSNAAPQGDGSVVYMGRGHAEIVHTAAGACTTVGGSRATAQLMAFVSSADGHTAEVDITTMDADFPTTVQCGPHTFESDAGVSVPPAVSLPLQDGASVEYQSESRSMFARGGERGTVRLEFCRPLMRGAPGVEQYP